MSGHRGWGGIDERSHRMGGIGGRGVKGSQRAGGLVVITARVGGWVWVGGLARVLPIGLWEAVVELVATAVGFWRDGGGRGNLERR